MIRPIVERVGDELKINLFPKQAEFVNSDVDDILYGGSAGGGKALNINTLIPTPISTSKTGFKTMEEIQPGDYVFSPGGESVAVVAISPIEIPEECYEISFDTGESFIVDGRHLWKTFNDKERARAACLTDKFREARRIKRPSRAIEDPRNPVVQALLTQRNKERIYEYKDPPTGTIRSTREMYETVTVRNGERLNHSIDVTLPIQGQDIELPIEPYLFGVWLGDGNSNGGQFCKPIEDMEEILSHIHRPYKKRFEYNENRKPLIVARIEGLTTQLRKLGVIKNKHIPEIYKRASLQQRLALLHGLCDTDGSCSKEDGGIELGFSNKRLIEDAHEIICSIGIKSTIRTRRAFLNGKDYGDCYRIGFVSSILCFRLKRKGNRQKLEKLKPNTKRRFIVSIKRVPSIKVKCIQVANLDGMYLIGKSFIPTHNSLALLIFAAIRRMSYPGSNGLMLRRTFSQLEKSLILRSREIYPLFGATYHESKKLWSFPNGSLQHFGYLERDADTFNYHSDEYHDICFDESSLFTPFQITYMTSRCRSTLPGCKALIRLASNPGNVGHLFLKEKYIEPSKTNKIWKDPVTNITRSFIPAKLDDNPAMMELDPGYKDRLRILGDQKYLALAEGNWDVFEGAYFNFDIRPGHGVLPYRRVPDTDTFKFLSLDWGYADPAAIYWYELMPSGRLIIYRELYITRLSPKELATKILEMCPSSERYEYIACSPEIWGKKIELDGGGESIQALMQTVLSDKIPMIKAPNARIPGWLKVKEYMFNAGDGRPWVQISPVCENLIKEIVGAIHEDRPGGNVEDVSSMCSDHGLESFRYACMTLQNAPQNQNEIISPYERLFGIKTESKNFSNLPETGRGGY